MNRDRPGNSTCNVGCLAKASNSPVHIGGVISLVVKVGVVAIYADVLKGTAIRVKENVVVLGSLDVLTCRSADDRAKPAECETCCGNYHDGTTTDFFLHGRGFKGETRKTEESTHFPTESMI